MNQAAFVPGRQILDNVIISHEFLHHLKKKKQGKNEYFALKLDMSKAYDRVEWKFLQEIMKKMGFSDSQIVQGAELNDVKFLMGREEWEEENTLVLMAQAYTGERTRWIGVQGLAKF
nr:uncharacterized protein LOC113734469 [Coffea arabica]